MNTVIRTSDPADLVAFVPYALGFRPRESVVLLGLRPPRSAVGLTMRLDIAHLADDATGSIALDEARSLLASDGSTDAFVVLYSDLPGLGRDSPAGRAVHRLREESTWCELPGPWVVGAERYGVWGRGADCAPLTEPVSELAYGAIAARLVLEGAAVAPGRESLGVTADPDPVHREAAVRAHRKSRRRRAELVRAVAGAVGGCDAEALVALERWHDRQLHLWHRLVTRARGRRQLGAGELGRLLAGLETTAVRDAVLTSAMEMASDVESNGGGVPLGGGQPDLAPLDGASLVTLLEHSPSPTLLHPALAVLSRAAAVTGGVQGAPALAVLACLAWWSGDSARADVTSEQCLRLCPEDTLAGLVRDLVAHQIPPSWVAANARR